MKNGSNEEVTPYGACKPLTHKEKKTLENILTKLNGNAILGARLLNALQLQDTPGHPVRADMSMVRIVTDMFQGGHANYEFVNPPPLTAINIGHPARKYHRGYFAGPNPLPLSGDAENSVFTVQNSSLGAGGSKFAMFRNPLKDIRVSNAWVKYLPDQATNLNPSTDTRPHAIHCEFQLDGNIVWEQVQNNLVSSAADWSFMSQTADSNWNGIVPKGSVFSFKFYITDGATGLPADTADPDYLQAGLIALAVPFGAQLPS